MRSPFIKDGGTIPQYGNYYLAIMKAHRLWVLYFLVGKNKTIDHVSYLQLWGFRLQLYWPFIVLDGQIASASVPK